MSKEEVKAFERLKNRTTRLIDKCSDKGIEFSNIEVGAISQVGEANTWKELSWLVIEQMDRIFEKYKIR